MTVNFQIDRVDPPVIFYTLKEGANEFLTTSGVDVFAETGEHRRHDMAYMGRVTFQTPFGQGEGLGYTRRNLRWATPDEVRRALARTHEKGAGYVPEIQPYMSLAKYRLIKLRWRAISARQRKAIEDRLKHA